jgi:hypothetical protein
MAELLDRLDGTVHSDPGQDLGVGEMPARPADLSDSVVGPAPVGLQELHQLPLQGPRGRVRLDAQLPGLVEGVGIPASFAVGYLMTRICGVIRVV